MNDTPAEPNLSSNLSAGRGLPEGIITLLAFGCCLAVAALAFMPSLATLVKGARGGAGPLFAFFGSILAAIALAYAYILTKSRRDDQKRFALTGDAAALHKTPKDTLSFYGGFAVIGAMFFFVADKGRGNWPLFIECNVEQFVAFLVLRWAFSRPPTAAQIAAPASVDWLSKRSAVRVTPTEIVLQMPKGARAFIGGFSLIMLGMTVTCLLLAFAPGLFDPHPKHPYGPYFTVMPLLLFVAMAFFTTLILGGAGPRDLRMELDTRRYTQVYWKPVPGMSAKDGFCIPFRTVRASGTMDDDMAGVCVRTYRYKGNTGYIVQIAWRDTRKPPQVLSRFTVLEEAHIALTEAAQALRLPALEGC